MVFEKAKALKQDILEFRSLQENELSYWSISFKDYGLAFIGKQIIDYNIDHIDGKYRDKKRPFSATSLPDVII